MNIDTLKSIKNKKMLYILFCIIQFLLFYILPLTGGPTDVMGVVFLMYIGTMVNSLIIGLTPLKLRAKLLFTFVVIVLFIPCVFLPFFGGDTEVLYIYTPTLAATHLAFVILGVGVRKLVELIRKALNKAE